MRLFFTRPEIAARKAARCTGRGSSVRENYCTLTGIVALIPPVPVIVTV